MSATGKLMLACRDCGKESEVLRAGDGFDRVFACGFCGASYEIGEAPSIDEINRGITELGKDVFAALIKNLKRR